MHGNTESRGTARGLQVVLRVLGDIERQLLQRARLKSIVKYLPTYIPTYMYAYLPIYLYTYIPISLHTYMKGLHTYIPAYRPFSGLPASPGPPSRQGSSSGSSSTWSSCVRQRTYYIML